MPRNARLARLNPLGEQVPTPRPAAMARRAKYARTNQPVGNLLVAGSPDLSEDPVWYISSDQMSAITSNAAPTSMAAVTRATSLIADTLSSIRWRTLSAQEPTFPRKNLSETPPPRWLTDPTLLRPDDRYGQGAAPAARRLARPEFWGAWIRSALWHGMGYLLFEESEFDGRPVAGTLRLLNPEMVTGQYNQEQGYVNRRISGGGESVATDRDGRVSIGGRVYRLMELRNRTAEPDEYGITKGVLETHARELGLASQAIEYATGGLKSGVPAGYLKVNVPNFTSTQAEQLQRRWLEHHGNERRSIAVLNASTDFTALQVSAHDAQLLESRQMSLVDIANAFGVPVAMLNGSQGDSSTYSNIESRSLDFRTYTLLPWSSLIEEVVSALLPTGQWCELDMRTLLRADTKTRYESYGLALNAGFLTVDEVREAEGLPALEGSGE